MKVKKTNEILYLSNIVSIYNKISVCTNTTQSTITKRLNKIYKNFSDALFQNSKSERLRSFNFRSDLTI